MDTFNICRVVQQKFSALLYLCGKSSNQNMIFFPQEVVYVLDNLWTVQYEVLKTLLYCTKILCIRQRFVCCAVSRKRIVAPLFFEETITAGSYPHLLTQFVALLEKNTRDCWFQQDVVTALLR
jgi:hypothetical protein